MANNYFSFKQFTVRQDKCAFKVGTDGVLLGACADVAEAGRILDIGTGSGLIALMVAQKSNADITAIEPDIDSYHQAAGNIQSSKWASRIHLLNVALQDFDPGSQRFDLVITNPPYFKNSLKNPDPALAAARHNDTLSNSDLLHGVRQVMASGGRFQVILPYPEGNILIAEAQEYGLYCQSILKIRPLPASEVRRLILTFSDQKQRPVERFLTIESGPRHEFTEEYKSLTGAFYLNF